MKLCDYHPEDKKQFGRLQLFKGMINQDIARVAHTYSHDTDYVEQAASRHEAFDMGSQGGQVDVSSGASPVQTVERDHNKRSHFIAFGTIDRSGSFKTRRFDEKKAKKNNWKYNNLLWYTEANGSTAQPEMASRIVATL